MPISLLRKAPPRREPTVAPVLADLSLPDMTKPLIDPSAWVNLPPQAAAELAAAHASGKPASHYDDHLSSQPINMGPRALAARGRAPSRVRDPNGGSPDFHRPFSPTSVAAIPAVPSGGPGRARRAGRRAASLTVVVAGPSGAGKTSFIDALTGVLDPDALRLGARIGPTKAVTRHEVNVVEERRNIILLDTPGLPSGDPLSAATRVRALGALLGIVENRLARLLSEETKVVRRKSDGGELVHLVIYVIDARTILCPIAPVEVDWDSITEPTPGKVPMARPESELLEADPSDVAARLPVDDIEAMRRLAVRANVLPVLTHSDALTKNELEAVRGAVCRDLATVFGRDPIGSYGVLSPGDDIEEAEDDDESEPPSAKSPDGKPNMPYAVFAPELGPGFTRQFRWGRADAANAAHSDLPSVRDAVINAADWLRTQTREVVYERFRTERLLTARGTLRV